MTGGTGLGATVTATVSNATGIATTGPGGALSSINILVPGAGYVNDATYFVLPVGNPGSGATVIGYVDTSVLPVLLKSNTGSINISGTVDNLVNNVPVGLTFATSGSVSVAGRIGFYNGRIGSILLQGNGAVVNPLAIQNLTFGTAGLFTTVNAERLSLVSSADALRGNVSIFATQDYANGTVGTKAIYLELVGGAGTSIIFADSVIVSQTTSSLFEADALVVLDGNGLAAGGTGGSLTLAKGLTTSGQLSLLDMKAINVGNGSSTSTVQTGVQGITIANPVVLLGNTVFRADDLLSGDISFGSSITNSGTSRNLNIKTAGAVTFNSLGDAGQALGDVTLDVASKGLSILGAASIVNVGGLFTTVPLVGPINLSAPTAIQNYRGNVELRTSIGSIKTNNMNLNSIGNVTLNSIDATSGTIEVLGSVSNIANFFSQEAGTKVLVGNASPVILTSINGSTLGFNFVSPVVLMQNLSINPVSGVSGTNITFNNTIDSATAVRTLTLNTSNGDINFFNNIGNTTGGLARITLAATASGSGKVVFNGSANVIKTQGGFSVTGNAIINASTTFNESGGNIQFVNDLSGNGNLTNDATFSTTGQLLFGSLGQSATGPAGALKDILITGANPSLFSSGAISAQSLKTDGSVTVAGAFTVSGAQTYTDAAAPIGDNDVLINSSGTITMGVINTVDGLNLSTISSGSANIILSNTNATGDALLNHGGNLQFTGTSFKANSFTETSGTGSVLLGAGLGSAVTIEVTGITEDILFSRPVLLNDGATLKGSGAGSSLTFGSTVRAVGAKALNINNIQGNIIFQGNVGDNSPTQPLGDISITNGSPTLLQAMGTIFNAASVSVSSTTPVIGNIDFSTVTTTLTGTNGLTLSTNHDDHIINLQKDIAGTGFSVGQVLNVGQTGGTITTIATIKILSIDGAGGIASFEIRTAGVGYSTIQYDLYNSTTLAITAAKATVTQINSSSNIALGPVNLSSAGGLTLNSSPSDTVTLTGNITNAAGITQNGAVEVTLGSNAAITLTTAGSSGAVFGGDLIVAQNTQMNVGGGITITGTIDSVDGNNIRTLGLQSTLGTINTNGEIGSSVPLFNFTANAGAAGIVTIQDITDTSVSVTTQSGITITGNLNLVEDDTTLDGGTGSAISITGNISGPVASTDLTLKTNGGAISVTGATGIGTGSVRMGEIVIDGTPASLQITGSIYADSISTINNLAGAISVGGSQFITNNVKLYSNNGPINLGSITTDNGGLLTAVSGISGGTGYAVGMDVTVESATNVDDATAVVTAVSSGAISTVTPTTSGTGFVNNQSVTFTRLISAAAGTVATETGGVLNTINVTSSGTGYVVGDTVNINATGATQATGLVATVDPSFRILTITVTGGGAGFSAAQTVTITGVNNTGGSPVGTTATVASNIDIEASTGTVTLGALNAGVNAAGAINIKHGSTLTLNNNITAGSFTETVGSNGNIVVGNTTPVTFQVSGTNTGFQFLNPVQLKQNLTILSNSDVIFNGTVDTQTGSASRNLAITVQSGTSKDVTFSGAVGGTSGVVMGDITIGGAAAINAGTNTITALSLDATATGVITLKGLQTYSGSSGLKLTADGDIFVGSITTSNNGSVSFTNDVGLNILGNISSAGSITQTTKTGGAAASASLVTFGDTNSANTLVLQSTTSGLPVSFDASMVLNKDVQFKSVGTGSITVGTTSGTNTTIKSGGSGSYNLLIQATGGALINLNSDIGGTNAENLASLTVATVSASGGKTNIASRTIKTGGVAGQTFTGNVDYANNLTLSSASGPITFNNQLDSTNAANLTLTSNGALSFQAIGSSKVGDILITAASNGLSGTSINAASLKTGTGIALIGNILITGIQTYTSDIDLDTTAGISMGNSITSNTGKIDLTSGGTTLVNALTTLNAGAGTITLRHGATLSLLGNILSGNSFTEIATQSTNILVGSGGASPVTITVGSGLFSIGQNNVTQLLLNNDLEVTSNGTGAGVTFGSVIDSAASAAKGIAINTTGDIIFGGNIGQATNARLGAISLTNNALSLTATNVNIKAGSFTTGASTAVQGAIDLSGTIDLNAAAGLTLKTDTTGSLTAVGSITGGGGYSVGMDVTIASATSVTNATAKVTVVSSGAITTVSPTTFGSGFVNNQSVTLTRLISAAAGTVASVAGTALSTVTVTSSGTGYVVGDAVNINATGATQATGTVASVDASNKILTITVTGASSGTGFTVGQAVTITGVNATTGVTTGTATTTPSLGTLKLGPVTTINGGNVVLTHSGLLTLLGDVIANGNITETATGISTPDVEIGNITNSGTVTLNSNPTNGFISLSRPVTLNQSLAIQASGNGNIAISTVDANSAALTKDLTITILGATGVVTLNGSLGAVPTKALTKVQVNAGASGSIGINGTAITTIGASGQSFTAGSTNYILNLTLDAGSGPIAFVGGLNSSTNANLTLATIGALSFGGAVGAGGALGDIDTTLASSGLTATTISAKSFDTNVALAGPISITGAQTYTDLTTGFLKLETSGTSNMAMTSVSATIGGINLKTAQGTIFVGALTASHVTGGDIVLNHGGNLTLSGNIIAGDTLVITSGLNTLISVGTIAGALIPPAVILIDVNNSDVAFGTNVDLVQNLTIQNRNSNNVIFSGFLDSSNTTKDLSISTTGNVFFVKTVGQIAASRLGDIAISNGASSLTASADVNAKSLSSGVVAGAINFAGTQNYAGASGLTLSTTGASGNITVNGVTTTLGAVNFTNSNTLSLLGNISSFGQIKQQAGTGGTVAVTTGVTTNNTQLTFNSTNSGLDFATSILTNQDSQFSSSTNGLIDIRSAIFSAPSIPRKLTVSNVNGTINFGGNIGSAANSFSQVVISAGATGIVNLAGANVITTGSSGQSFTAGSTNYTSNLTLDAGSGSIGFVGGLNSSNSKNLNLTNTGTLSFNGAVGAVGALGDIRITGASNGLIATAIKANSLETATNFALIGPVSITGTQDYSNNLKLETAGTNNISVGAVNTTTGSIVLLTDQGNLNVGVLTASASNINLTHGGTLTFAGDIFAGTTLVVNSTNGSAIIVGTDTDLDISMRALAGGISLTGPVSLVNNLSATAGAGAINFGSTINSAAGRNLALSLTAANPVTFGGNIGQTSRLGDISITGAPAGIDATTKNISAKSFVASASTGAINLRGTLDFNGANGFNVTTTDTTVSGTAGNITLGQLTTSAGAVLISNSQILQLLGNVLSAGSITESGAGTVVLGDAGAVSPTITVSTTTAGSGIVFGKNITLNKNGVLTAAGAGNVTLSGTVDNAPATTARGLTLNSGSGTISLNDDIGQVNGGLASVNATTTGN
ncbi:MAG: hypothetical protein DWI07_00225, partial [Planctomycetota bacterium]